MNSDAHRERLGQVVREAWLVYCYETGRTVKPHHLTTWDNMDEWEREVDRRIGEAVEREVLTWGKG